MENKIASLLGQIERLSLLSKVKVEIETVLNEFQIEVEQHGLNSEQVNRAYEIALGGHLISTHSISLLENILPREPLESRPILGIISILGNIHHSKQLHAGRVSYQVQKKAIEGLVSLLEVGAVSSEGREMLSDSWSMLETGLTYSILRDASARILYLITRRCHVQPCSITSLVEMMGTVESPPASLLQLLYLFRSFYPKFVTIPLFSHTIFKVDSVKEITRNKIWLGKLAGVRSGGKGDGGESSKKRKASEINGHFHRLPSYPSSKSISLSDVHDLKELVSNPNVEILSSTYQILQSVAGSKESENDNVIRDESERLKIWALILKCGYGFEGQHLYRINSYINSNLMYDLTGIDSTPESEARVRDLFCRIRELCSIGGELIEEFEPMLHFYLKNWDGESNRDVIFDLIALQKPLPYHLFYQFILEPLQRLSVSASPLWLANLFACLTEFIHNLAMRDDWELDENGERILITVFGELKEEISYDRCLQEICEQVDRIIIVSTQIYPDSVVLRSAALSFYEMTLTLPVEHKIAIVMIPATSFTFLCLLSNECMSVSRICSIFARLRDALTLDVSIISKQSDETLELTPFLNFNLIEFINTIWMKKFLSDDGELLDLSRGELDSIRLMCELRNQNIAASQGLTIHSAFSHLARECFEEWAKEVDLDLSNFNSPVTFSTLKDIVSTGSPISPHSFTDFRVRFLEYLKHRGAVGIEFFLFSSLQSLVTRRSSESTGQ